jgi:hypothetical protein
MTPVAILFIFQTGEPGDTWKSPPSKDGSRANTCDYLIVKPAMRREILFGISSCKKAVAYGTSPQNIYYYRRYHQKKQ